jgi:hypothetical protein
MDSWIGVSISLVLLIGLWVPYYISLSLVHPSRQGRALGHTWFTSWKRRGHTDIGADLGGFLQTRPGVDDARGATDSGRDLAA